MKSFRFRLDPVIRLKKYNIERKETEIAEIDQEISRILQEIEDGRQHVLDMRKRLMDDVSDDDFIREEQSLDLFQHYMQRTEAEKREKIKEWETKKALKRNELLELYREDKILERYKEKKQADWQREANQQEISQMDEIGIQNYLRNSKNRGGVLLYLIVPLVLIAAGAGVGMYTGMINNDTLSQIPYVKDWIRSTTDAVQVLSATPEDWTLTIGEVFDAQEGTTMAQALQNIQDKLEEVNARMAELNDKERLLNLREESLKNDLQQISDYVALASQQIETKRDLERQIQERQQSELSQNELQTSEFVKKMDPKLAASFFSDLYTLVDDPNAVLTAALADPNAPPEEPKLTDNQRLALRLWHQLEQKQRTTFMDAMMKNAPTRVIAAQLIRDFNTYNMDVLLDIKPIPTPEPILPGLLDSATDTQTVDSSDPNLPPPVQQSAG
jgi:flagellar FliJ protein